MEGFFYFFLFILHIFEVNYGAIMEMSLELQLLSCFFYWFSTQLILFRM